MINPATRRDLENRPASMAAPISIGDNVEIRWSDTGWHDTGRVEQVVLAGPVKLRIAGPAEITIVIPAKQLREVGAHRRNLDL